MYSMFPNMPPFLAPQDRESKLAQGFPAAERSLSTVRAPAQLLSDPLSNNPTVVKDLPVF